MPSDAYNVVFKRAKRIYAHSHRPAPEPTREDKAALTAGRKPGRSTTAQHEVLERLGVPRDKSIKMTAHKAGQTITRLMGRADA